MNSLNLGTIQWPRPSRYLHAGRGWGWGRSGGSEAVTCVRGRDTLMPHTHKYTTAFKYRGSSRSREGPASRVSWETGKGKTLSTATLCGGNEKGEQSPCVILRHPDSIPGEVQSQESIGAPGRGTRPGNASRCSHLQPLPAEPWARVTYFTVNGFGFP